MFRRIRWTFRTDAVDYCIPACPTGFTFTLRILNSCGDPFYVGLNGLQLLDRSALSWQAITHVAQLFVMQKRRTAAGEDVQPRCLPQQHQ